MRNDVRNQACIHQTNIFGAQAYVHVPVSPGRNQHDSNVKIGHVLGYTEYVVGCKVNFPDAAVAQFVSDLSVVKNILY